MKAFPAAVACILLLMAAGCRMVPSEQVSRASSRFSDFLVRLVSEESFETPTEYFTGQETPGKRLIVRSQPEKRAGLYFLFRLAGSGPLPEGNFRIVAEAVDPHQPDPHTASCEFTFVPGWRRMDYVWFGLTGEDWPDKEAIPTGWTLKLLDPEGREVDTRSSFAWKLP